MICRVFDRKCFQLSKRVGGLALFAILAFFQQRPVLAVSIESAKSLINLLPKVKEEPSVLRPPTKDELARLEQDIRTGVKCGKSSCKIARSLFEKTERESEKLGEFVRLAPYKNGQQIEGLKLYSALPTSLLAGLLLQEGDVIKSINGIEFNSPLETLGGYLVLKSASKFVVKIKRDGKVLHQYYSVH